MSLSAAGFSRAWRPALLAGLLSLAIPGLAWRGATLEATALSEAQVKAAFLFNFAKFVQWPGRSEGPLIIGIAGDDKFAETVAQTVRGQKVNGREFQTRLLATGDDPSGCQVLFIAVMRSRDATELMQRVRGPVLTVGVTVQFVREGGIVRFYVENNKVRFQISQENAEAAGLKISSQLLMLASR